MDNTSLWVQNLKELKKMSNLSNKQLAEKTGLPERTVVRIIAGDTDHPRIDTLYNIVTALGGTLNDIFADTNIIVATEKLVEIKESVDVVEAEKDIVIAENSTLKAENTNLKDQVKTLTAKIELLEMKLAHKDELLAVHNLYNKLLK
jgi:transcriptional regulator with XRE-family HTH domain